MTIPENISSIHLSLDMIQQCIYEISDKSTGRMLEKARYIQQAHKTLLKHVLMYEIALKGDQTQHDNGNA